MAQQWVLVHKTTGDEFVFTNRADYINTKASGLYDDKPAGEPAARDWDNHDDVDVDTGEADPVTTSYATSWSSDYQHDDL